MPSKAEIRLTEGVQAAIKRVASIVVKWVANAPTADHEEYADRVTEELTNLIAELATNEAAARAALTEPLLALSKMAHYRHDGRELGWKEIAYEDCNARSCYEVRELLK